MEISQRIKKENSQFSRTIATIIQNPENISQGQLGILAMIDQDFPEVPPVQVLFSSNIICNINNLQRSSYENEKVQDFHYFM